MTVVSAVAEVVRDLVIGDDWRMTAGVVVLLLVIAGLHAAAVPVWWVPPLGMALLLLLGVSGKPR